MDKEQKEQWINKHVHLLAKNGVTNEQWARNYLNYLYNWTEMEGLIPYEDDDDYPDNLVFLVPDKSEGE